MLRRRPALAGAARAAVLQAGGRAGVVSAEAGREDRAAVRPEDGGQAQRLEAFEAARVKKKRRERDFFGLASFSFFFLLSKICNKKAFQCVPSFSSTSSESSPPISTSPPPSPHRLSSA